MRFVFVAGLCRTCEVFGVKEFVIGSLKYVSDTNFSSLSVTAQKWIDIREVELTTVNNVIITQIANKFSIFNVFANKIECFNIFVLVNTPCKT